MNCPKCSKPTLATLTVDGIEVERCFDCKGMWFDRAELGRLLDSDMGAVDPILPGDQDVGLDAKAGVCPKDRSPLLRVQSARNAEITLDACPTCQGLWLDGGEFRRIKEAQPNLRLGDFV